MVCQSYTFPRCFVADIDSGHWHSHVSSAIFSSMEVGILRVIFPFFRLF